MSNFDQSYESAIAIVGSTGRFPGAKDISAFWNNVRNGIESVTFHTDEELKAAGVAEENIQDPNYVKANAMLDNIEFFDAAFFGYTPREASMMDPQQRFFLEGAWEALENAGYDPERYDGLIGVYGGAALNTYMILNLLSNPDLIKNVGEFQTMIGNDKDFLPTRVSYKLNLKGPSVNIQTACSTSLTAVHMACQSLLNGECDMALAGGVSIKVSQGEGYPYQEGGISSPDGHCRAFDENSQGTVFGSGMGIVVLKRLEDAIEDGDSIQAIIRGSAINNDGDMKIGYTAPSVDGQAEVITEALAVAGVSPDTIGYIETHGTGTPLGDPIEIMGLTRAFQADTDEKQFCPIGSVKTNIGHLDAAAGVTGLIKTVESLKHKEIAPSLHFEKPNAKIEFENSPFYVNTALKEWVAGEEPRRAGVSSFGVGGTNVHVILEEAPVVSSSDDSKAWKLFVLSAKTEAALEEATERLRDHLSEQTDINLADASYTLQIGRRAFEKRRMIVCRNREEAIQALEDPKRISTHEVAQDEQQPVVFMFPGQGAQYVDMGRELYQSEMLFRKEVDRCAEILTEHIGFDIRTLLYPEECEATEAASKLKQTQYTQPALFVIEYSLAKLWMAWGIKPDAMIGHSVGEYVAACLSGVFCLKDALALISMRGKMIQQLPQGSMLAVPLPEQDIKPLLGKDLSIAAINGPALCVVSGETEVIKSFQAKLEAQDIEAVILHTSHAFHSKMMDPILTSFEELVNNIEKQEPTIPYVSNLTGTWIQEGQATSPEYWAQHLRQAVRFAEGIETLREDSPVFIEVGPGRTLSMLTKQQKVEPHHVITSMRHVNDKKAEDLEFLMSSIGKLWLNGVEVDWESLYQDEQRYRIPMPSYPFQRQSHWVEPNQVMVAKRDTQKLIDKKSNRSEWFYRPTWKQSPLPVPTRETGDETVIVFTDKWGLHAQVAEQLQSKFKEVITVKAGEAFDQQGSAYTINPAERNDYQMLIQSLDQLPSTVLHMWAVKVISEQKRRLSDFEQTQDLTFNSLLYLAQAFGIQNTEDQIRLMVVTNNVQSILGDEVLYPEASIIAGPVRVIPQEYPNIDCSHVDISISAEDVNCQQRLAGQIVSEATSSAKDTVVAYRGNYRWQQTFDAVPLQKTELEENQWRQGGVYLLTGGLGGIGLAIAEKLASDFQAKLVLIGRSGLPDKQEWKQYLTNHGGEDRISQRIKKIQKLEELGAKVLTFQADVSDVTELQSVVSAAEQHFGNINGVIHLAGIPGAGLIQLKTPEMAANVLAPKVKGALALDEVLKGKELDFMILFSSLSAIYGGLGQVDYAAANSFLDTFAHYHHAQQNRLTISINWGQWQFDDWQGAALPTATVFQEELRQNRETFGMTFEEGIDALFRTLYAQQPQMAITTQDLHALIEQHEEWKATSAFEQLETIGGISNKLDTVRISDNLSMSTNEEITKIWKELFGMEQISIHDDFFDLGGHSLLAVQLLARLREVFQVELSLNQLFEAPSIAGIAEWISKIELESLEDDELESLLVEIESLTDDDIEDEIAAAIHLDEEDDGHE